MSFIGFTRRDMGARLLLLGLLFNLWVAWSDPGGSNADAIPCTQLDSVLAAKRQLYSPVFPDIYF